MFLKFIVSVLAFAAFAQAAPQFISNPYQRQPGQQQPPSGYQPNPASQGFPGSSSEYGDGAQLSPGYPQAAAQPQGQAGPPPPPQINWGNCSQLKPNEREMQEKANIIKTCLEAVPLPSNITQESVEKHRHDVAKCALEKENWFNQNGQYRYEKAETEIRNKRLNGNVEVSQFSIRFAGMFAVIVTLQTAALFGLLQPRRTFEITFARTSEKR